MRACVRARVGVRVCVCVCRMNLTYVLRWHIHIIISSFRTMPVLYTHTRILRSFEDSELAGLKVDIALTQLDLE